MSDREPEVDEVLLAVLRQKVLSAFGVTEEDLAEIEQRTGYLAAKARHEYAREHFLAHVKAYTTKLTEMLNAEAAKLGSGPGAGRE